MWSAIGSSHEPTKSTGQEVPAFLQNESEMKGLIWHHVLVCYTDIVDTSENIQVFRIQLNGSGDPDSQ